MNDQAERKEAQPSMPPALSAAIDRLARVRREEPTAVQTSRPASRPTSPRRARAVRRYWLDADA